MSVESSLVPYECIEQRILLLRGQKVMLSHDLAALYGVETKALVQAVKRNAERFPPDFMFQLTKEEFEKTLMGRIGGRRITTTLGSGGPTVRVVTTNGPAIVRRR